MLFCWIEFGAMVGQAPDDGLTKLSDWRARVAQRPAAIASADPNLGISA